MKSEEMQDFIRKTAREAIHKTINTHLQKTDDSGKKEEGEKKS